MVDQVEDAIKMMDETLRNLFDIYDDSSENYGEIEIQHCPTYHMIADFFTKPFTGKLFHIF